MPSDEDMWAQDGTDPVACNAVQLAAGVFRLRPGVRNDLDLADAIAAFQMASVDLSAWPPFGGAILAVDGCLGPQTADYLRTLYQGLSDGTLPSDFDAWADSMRSWVEIPAEAPPPPSGAAPWSPSPPSPPSVQPRPPAAAGGGGGGLLLGLLLLLALDTDGEK